MKFKNLKPVVINKDRKIGEVLFVDGLVDATDPCYDRGTWCARYDIKVLPGMYVAMVDEVDYPSEIVCETQHDADCYRKPIGKKCLVNDTRIMCLTIFHKDYIKSYEAGDYKEYLWDKNIGVDAGLCGFYNHVPEHMEDDEWDRFWQSLDANDYGNTCDCHHGNGVTVSSGFGDGCYRLYKLTHDRKTMGLRLYFN